MYLEDVSTSSIAYPDNYTRMCEGKSCDIHKNNYTLFDLTEMLPRLISD
ncbi:unnamed protein product [Oppiella nova]|uniref:Uncharacterized protein n=1 Tax=Oppiella nova TaxID=334625 RepID=A0A7R9M863_9ACAR|nr:unnamed protein product [Oppiella nova]CAG2172566.1 unnamed protein product [Oppiella nova]